MTLQCFHVSPVLSVHKPLLWAEHSNFNVADDFDLGNRYLLNIYEMIPSYLSLFFKATFLVSQLN